MGIPPAAPSPPNWGDIDTWLSKRHSPADEGPAATHSQSELERFVTDANAGAESLTRNAVREHIPDALVVVLVSVFLLLLIRQHFVSAAVSPVTISPADGLSAFHVITDADLATGKLVPQAGWISSVEMARDRYLLQYVPRGSGLRQSQLSRTSGWSARLKGLSVLDLPVRLGPSVPPVEANVTLIASHRASKSPGAIVLKDVPLLAVKRTSSANWATVALSPDQVQTISPYLGNSEILLARTVD